MNITPINSNAFTGRVIVYNNDTNKHIKYLYNNLSDIVKKQHVPAVFGGDLVEITPHKSQQNALTQTLKSLGINFSVKNDVK